MNRTIKFRGKRVDGKGWVIGYYVYRPDGKHLIYWKPFNEATQNTYHEVIPETVCQFTGLHDKNWKEIYEGDLICVHKNHNGYLEVEFVNAYVGGWVLSHESTDRKLSLGARNRNDLEITGNIHDND